MDSPKILAHFQLNKYLQYLITSLENNLPIKLELLAQLKIFESNLSLRILKIVQ